jgi:putative DNA methylase
MNKYPKRLIEVDLPIKRISAHSRREKSIRHGHIATLHIWWARRPLAACRAVTCAALWPDPADELCPQAFIQKSRELMLNWTRNHLKETICKESLNRFVAYQNNPEKLDDLIELRQALLEFIADFSAWESSSNKAYLDTARALTQAAHEALGGTPGTRPLVVDPFAGGGAIPLEALRVGADTFASDLNPVAVLLNKMVLEYIPKYGQKLANEVRKWGQWVKEQAEKELSQFYPKDEDGATPIAYLWARTITCEGPGCGAKVPLIRSLWLAKKNNKSVAAQMIPNPKEKRVDFEIIEKKKDGWFVQGTNKKIDRSNLDGTVARGSVTCPCCGYTTPVQSVREQLKKRHGGANDAQMWAVVTTRTDIQGRFYRLPTQKDMEAVKAAQNELHKRVLDHKGKYSLLPDEKVGQNELRRISVPLYGMIEWADIFSARQNLTISTLGKTIQNIHITELDKTPVLVSLALTVDKIAQYNSSLCRWKSTGENVVDTFGRQALGMVWDFAEANPFGNASGDWLQLILWFSKAVELTSSVLEQHSGHIEQASATKHPLPDDVVNVLLTDPPYYDAIPYSHLSDFFYVILKRILSDEFPNLFGTDVVEKNDEIVVDRPHSLSSSKKDIAFYEKQLEIAFTESRRIVAPEGVGAIVFASKTTASWEAILQAIISAGWTVTASWPIDTEMETKVAAIGQARLMSSVHIVCRPRENEDGSLRTDDIGDWRQVLGELPGRIKEWMVRLADEGVVGADAIFACLGPALEIFSRYSKVEKANGEQVMLREYLEQVWAAVSNEALEQVFKGANTSSFEEDARLTAMWLWTLGTGGNGSSTEDSDEESENTDEETPACKGGKLTGGYVLEYDAARKIAQGLGAHLEQLANLIEVSGDKARLLPVSERTDYLFGKQEVDAVSAKGRKKQKQAGLFDKLEESIEEDGSIKINGQKIGKLSAGQTSLDRVHQAMLLFAAGRSEAVRRFLVDDGVGVDSRFWTLSQALSALYPKQADEKRWIDGILSKKKGLGF